MSAGMSLPKRIFAHGWWTHDGQKISKSLGSVVNPFDIIRDYGLDQLRYFLFREVRFGEDGDFSEEALKNRATYDLSNDIGNLVQRVLVFIQKFGGCLTVNYNFTPNEEILFTYSRNLVNKMRPMIDKQDLFGALSTVWSLVSESNKFMNDMQPWMLAKTDTARLNAVLTVLCESIRAIAFGISPFMPDTAGKIFGFMNIEGKTFAELENNFTDQRFVAPTPLFPKEK
jgi:methionyl-tRNA synthetase